MVPSPPHASTRRAPLARASLARSRAWPRCSVRKTSTASPCASIIAEASSTRRRAISGRTPPEMGLMMMAVGIRLRQGQRANIAITIHEHDTLGGHGAHGVRRIAIDNRVAFLGKEYLTA